MSEKRTLRGFELRGQPIDERRAPRYGDERVQPLETLSIHVSGGRRIHGIDYSVNCSLRLELWPKRKDPDTGKTIAQEWTGRPGELYLQRVPYSAGHATEKARAQVWAELQALILEHTHPAADLLRAHARVEAADSAAARAAEELNRAEEECREAGARHVAAVKAWGEATRTLERLKPVTCAMCGATARRIDAKRAECPKHGALELM